MSLRRKVIHHGLRRASWLTRKQDASASAQRGGHGVESLEPRVLLSFDPSPAEQQMLELVNRFRGNPAAELGLLTDSLGTPAHSLDPDINNNLVGFNVNGPTLQTQWNALVAAPPLAWSETLSSIALAHNQSMISNNMQSHQTPDEPAFRARFNNGGYSSQTFIGENIFPKTKSVLMGHAGLAIDWGNGPGGIQSPAGHRNSLMSTNFTEIGISIVATPVQSNVGPFALTQDFGGFATPGNPFLLGVAYADADNDGFYDIGEGIAGLGVNIKGVSGTPGNFDITSMTAGGYQKQFPAGTYDVTFSGPALDAPVVVSNVVLGASNVKLDQVLLAKPVIALSGNGNAIVNNPATAATTTNDTDFGSAIVNSAGVAHTFTITNTGTGRLNLTGTPKVAISGANVADFTVTQVPATQLAVGAASQFIITFKPGAVGVRNAMVTIASDDETNGTYQFALKGTGIAPTIQVETAGQDDTGTAHTFIFSNNDITPTGNDLTDFRFLGVSTTGTGVVAVTRSYTIRNTGTSLLNFIGVTHVKITGANARDFSVTTLPAASVGVNGTTSFVITFNPIAAGLRTATVTIPTDDPLNPNFTFKIQGHAVTTATSVDNLQAAISAVEVAIGTLAVAPVTSGTIAPGTPITLAASNVTTTIGTITGVRMFYDTNRDGIPDKDLGAATFANGVFALTVNAPEEFTSGGQFLAQATNSLTNASHYRSNIGSAASAIDPGVVAGYNIKVNYNGYLTNGNVFDSSYRAGRTPFTFVLGVGSVIQGWDEGLVGMKVGETRILIIPAAIAYGANPPPGIPVNAPLIFEVTLLSFDVPAADLKGNSISIPAGDTTPSLTDGTDLGNAEVATISYAGQISFTGTKPTTVTSPGGVLNYNGTTGVGAIALPVGTNLATLTLTIPSSSSATVIPFTLPPVANFATTLTATGGTLAYNATTGIGSIAISANTTTATLKVNVPPGNLSTFTLANGKSGTQLGFTNFTVTGTHPGDFILVPPTGAATTFTMRFKPTAGGLRKAIISFDTNDPKRRTYTFAVQGNGTTMSIAVTDADASEPGTNAGTFTVFSSVALAAQRDVNFKLSGTGVVGVDYTLTATGGTITALNPVSKTGILTMNTGVTSATIDLTPINDTIAEAMETATITLQPGTGYAVTTAVNTTATINIADDAPTATVAATDAAASEIGTATGSFAITLTGDTAISRVVNFVLSGTTSLSDYNISAVGGTLSAINPSTRAGSIAFNAATSSAVITITPVADTLFEGNETVTMTLVPNTQVRLSGDLATTAATLTIADGNPNLLMALSKTAFLETAGANASICTITRTGLITESLTINLLSSDTGKGTVPATVTFLPGRRTVTFIISAVDNLIIDGQQPLTITASDPSGLYDDGTAQATVLDNEETTVTITSIGNDSASENAADEPVDFASFRITRADVNNTPLAVVLSALGLGTLGADYVMTNLLGDLLSNLTVVIPADQDHVDIVVRPIDDTLVEGDQPFTIGIALGASYTPGAQNAVECVIRDNESAISVAIPLGQETASESGQTATFRITRTGSTALPLTVFYKVTGTASTGKDYVSLGKAVTIPAGESFVDLKVTPLTDVTTEATENITLTLLPAKVVQYNIDNAAKVATLTLQDAANPGGVDLIAIVHTHKKTTYKLSGTRPKLTVSGTIKNQGTNATTTVFTVKAVLSKDRAFSNDDILLGVKDMLALVAGKTGKLSMAVDPVALSIGQADIGQYYLLLVVDSGAAVAEINETNNLFISLVSDIFIVA